MVINQHVLRHLENNKIIHDRQYGFRQYRSTGDILTYVTHIWNKTLETEKETLVVALEKSQKSSRFFTPLHPTFYKAQIRPCLEYGSHLWRGVSKYTLATLTTIQKRAIRLIDDSSLTDSFNSSFWYVPSCIRFYKKKKKKNT